MSTSKPNDPGSITADEDLPLFFGDWLKRRRKQLDLTQAELAQNAYCSVFALRKIEAGDRRPSKQLAGMLANALKIPGNDQTTFTKVARGELGIEKLLLLEGEAKPAQKHAQIPVNLPRALTPFIGRDPELSALGRLLHDPQCSLLTIVGVGGIGKTRLAIEAAHNSEDIFPDGIWFVSLAALNSTVQIVPAIADAAGFKLQDPSNPIAQLLRYMRTKQALLVLDNAEHLLDGTGIYTDILNDCQHVKLLVTSRERLNLLSEWVFEIQGLPVPPNELAKQFDAFSSVALFVQSARRVQAGFELQEDDRPWILKICQIMEGMPLGIELSAAWVGLLSIKEIAIEIEHNLDFLSVSMRDLPERHHSVRATLDHSWRLLTPEEKLILGRLSVFHGNFSRKDALSICDASLAILSSLRNKSLLERTDAEVYSLHEIIRQYAALKLAENELEAERIKDQHALYFVNYLAGCEKALQSSQQVETFTEMGKIIENLDQAWQHMLTHCLPNREKSQPFPEDMLHSALFSISLFYEMRCRCLEAIDLFTQSVTYLKSVQAEFEGSDDVSCYYSVLGHITAYLGLHHIYVLKYQQAVEYLEEAVKLLERSGSRVERAQAQVMLAAAMDSFGKLLVSASMLEQSRDIFRDEHVDWWYTLATTNLGSVYLATGKHEESQALYLEALSLVKPGDLRLELPIRNGYAFLLRLQKDFNKAEQILQESLQLSYRLGNERVTAHTLFDIGRIALADQRPGQAEGYFLKSINILREYGRSFDLAMVNLFLGKCLAAQSNRDAALEQYRLVIAIGREFNQFHLVYYGLVSMAGVFLTDGQIEEAFKIYLLLKPCPIEYIRMQEELVHLEEALHAAFPQGKMKAVLHKLEGDVDLDVAKANVLAYAQEHESL